MQLNSLSHTPAAGGNSSDGSNTAPASPPQALTRDSAVEQSANQPQQRAHFGRPRHPLMIEQMDARSSIGGKARPVRGKAPDAAAMAAQAAGRRVTVPAAVSRTGLPLAETRSGHSADSGGVADVSGSQDQAVPKPTFLSNARIRRLSQQEIMTVVDEFKKYLEMWEPDFERMSDEDRKTRNPDPNVPLTEKQKRLDRLMDTHAMILRMEMEDHSKSVVHTCYVDDQPVGMVIMQARETPYIGTLFTHPGLNGAGGVLIEEAVKQSIAWGKGGKVTLTPLDTAQDAYERLGFVGSGNTMTLDPVKSDKWHRQDGEWRLLEYLDKKYLVSLGE